MAEEKETLRFIDGHGREVTRPLNYVIDIRTFRETAGFALLFVAANTHLSVLEIWLALRRQGIGRGRNWIQRRRWLFQPPGTVDRRANRDGKDGKALAIMAEYPTASLRYIVARLKEHGIRRGKDWVRKRRCLLSAVRS